MGVTDWKKLNFNIREVVAALVFVFTISGVWYRLVYGTEEAHKENDMIKAQINDLNIRLNNYEERIKILETDKTRRDAIEEYNTGLQPMHKIKNN